MNKLREIILDCQLVEEFKWGKPCYMFDKKNVVLICGFKECCALMFFKGALLNDAHGISVKPGENTQAMRQVRFNNIQEIINKESILKTYINQAIEVERAGLTVNFKKPAELIMPEELQYKFDEVAGLKVAFNGLTPGRQRAYVIYFSAPKQSKTKTSRIEKCIEQILNGKGLND